MQKWKLTISLLICLFVAGISNTHAQCSICTKTAMQQGEKPASGLNSGIIYLMLTPFAVVGYIGYRWYKTEAHVEGEDAS